MENIFTTLFIRFKKTYQVRRKPDRLGYLYYNLSHFIYSIQENLSGWKKPNRLGYLY